MLVLLNNTVKCKIVVMTDDIKETSKSVASCRCKLIISTYKSTIADLMCFGTSKDHKKN